MLHEIGCRTPLLSSYLKDQLHLVTLLGLLLPNLYSMLSIQLRYHNARMKNRLSRKENEETINHSITKQRTRLLSIGWYPHFIIPCLEDLLWAQEWIQAIGFFYKPNPWLSNGHLIDMNNESAIGPASNTGSVSHWVLTSSEGNCFIGVAVNCVDRVYNSVPLNMKGWQALTWRDDKPYTISALDFKLSSRLFVVAGANHFRSAIAYPYIFISMLYTNSAL